MKQPFLIALTALIAKKTICFDVVQEKNLTINHFNALYLCLSKFRFNAMSKIYVKQCIGCIAGFSEVKI